MPARSWCVGLSVPGFCMPARFAYLVVGYAWVPRCVKAAMAGKLWPGPNPQGFFGYQTHSDERCAVPGFPVGTPTLESE